MHAFPTTRSHPGSDPTTTARRVTNKRSRRNVAAILVIASVGFISPTETALAAVTSQAAAPSIHAETQLVVQNARPTRCFWFFWCRRRGGGGGSSGSW